MPKPVAIIIVNYNTPGHTIKCITSLLDFCDESLFDVIVVDNGSKDGSLQTLQSRFPGVFFIGNKANLGFAEGNNVALRYALKTGYKYSLLTNSDTIVDTDILTPLKHHLDLNTNVAAVQPAIYWMHDRSLLWNGPGYFNPLTGNTISKTNKKYQLPDASRRVDWVTGCCVMLRNDALQQADLFNAKFFLYYEDADLSFRLRKSGYELTYLAAAKIYHEAGVSGKEIGEEGSLNPVIHYYTSRNHFWFIRRYVPRLFMLLALAYNLSYYSILLAYFKLRGRNKKFALLKKGIKEGLDTPLITIWPE